MKRDNAFYRTNEISRETTGCPDWMEEFAEKMALNEQLKKVASKTAVEVARERNQNQPSVFEMMSSIVSAQKPKYSSVEEAVRDYQHRTGLADYLKSNIDLHAKTVLASSELVEPFEDDKTTVDNFDGIEVGLPDDLEDPTDDLEDPTDDTALVDDDVWGEELTDDDDEPVTYRVGRSYGMNDEQVEVFSQLCEKMSCDPYHLASVLMGKSSFNKKEARLRRYSQHNIYDTNPMGEGISDDDEDDLFEMAAELFNVDASDIRALDRTKLEDPTEAFDFASADDDYIELGNKVEDEASAYDKKKTLM
jgi:hypothetical protein